MKCESPITIGKAKQKGIHVACGKCIPCLKNKRRDWTFRLQEEQRVSINSYFITLTYQEEYIPLQNKAPSLRKTHVQQFINKLRKYQERYWKKECNKADVNNFTKEYLKKRYSIRYYAVGEYGKNGDRPHYHIILFNVAPRIMDHINKIWNKGFVHIGTVNNKSIKYSTKYIIGNESSFLDRKNGTLGRKSEVEKCFSLKSLRPGIGASYLTDKVIEYHKKKYDVEKEVPLVRSDEGYFMKMPEYYRNIIFNSDAQEQFKKLMIEKGDELEDEDWNNKYKVYGERAEEKRIEEFENLKRRLKKSIKNSESL